MGSFDDHVAITGDWILPSPSSRAFFSLTGSDDVVAWSNLESGRESKSEPPSLCPEGQAASGNADQNYHIRASIGDNRAINSNAPVDPTMSSRGGLMERMAARAGFNAPRLNTESIRPAGISKNPEVRSPYLTIPPGLSPTTLLESPVFLSNTRVLPSPTTGKFSLAPTGNNGESTLVTKDTGKGKENAFEGTSSFAFKPIAEHGSVFYLNAANKEHPSSFAPQSFPTVGISVHSDASLLNQSIEPPTVHSQNSIMPFRPANYSNPHADKNSGVNLPSDQSYHSICVADNSPPLDDRIEDDGDPRNGGDPNAGEDGYNWRKYGQKLVKGSEYPRSYYKCTHFNCPVKKKVERSQEGQITEIIYKGAHNHPKPPSNRRALGSSNVFGEVDYELPGTGVNGDLIWSTMKKGNADWRQDNLEVTSSASLGQEYCNGGALQAQNGSQHEHVDGVDRSSTFSNDEDDDDRATHGSVSLGYDAEGDESESKRRRIETYASEISGATRAIREPRVVVQTTSEVDILDDGYRWRKYGQKVVKGNPNPRSYYKCTTPGCNVRKHVERASHDLKSVITTYEGKHNHDVPAARNSGHANSGSVSAVSAHQAARPEPSQVRGRMARFDRPPLDSYSLPSRPQVAPGPSFGFRMNQPGLDNLALAGLGQNQGKLPAVHQYLGHQPRPMNSGCFMQPKMEPVTDSCLNNSFEGSSVYQQFMGGLPRGPPM